MSHEIKHYYKREMYFIAKYKRGKGINLNISSNLRQGWGSVLQVDLAE